MKFDSTKALRNKEIFYRPLEKYLNKLFAGTIYEPLLDIIREEIGDKWVENSKEDLRKAILSGRIQYTQDQHFQGSFNSLISKEIVKLGGKWDKVRKQWYLPKDALPFDIQQAIGQSYSRFQRLQQRVQSFLDTLESVIQDLKDDNPFDVAPLFGEIVEKLETGFQEGAKGIIVTPELTPEIVDGISENWSENLNFYIKGWTIESINRLRRRVADNTFAGNRARDLVKVIQHDFGISENKAKFLARQETALLMSQFREERFKSAGVEKYRWSTSGDSRVRERHRELNGKVFTWDNPPIIDELGHRGHPGQDYNCRCIAIPIID